jgi:osmotically-inducible protein OsmY
MSEQTHWRCIVFPCHHRKEEEMTYRSDGIIKREVLNQLGWDRRVAQTEVGVTVNKGVVTLTGTVDNYSKKIAAQEAAHSVRGVLDVANELEVKVPGSSRRTDSEIAQAVRHALERNVFVPADRIRTTVSKGWVTLEGSVDHYSEGVAAVQTVRDLAAVRGVTNRIKVTTREVPHRGRARIAHRPRRQPHQGESRGSQSHTHRRGHILE